MVTDPLNVEAGMLHAPGVQETRVRFTPLKRIGVVPVSRTSVLKVIVARMPFPEAPAGVGDPSVLHVRSTLLVPSEGGGHTGVRPLLARNGPGDTVATDSSDGS
jgi:hypothetical protein